MNNNLQNLIDYNKNLEDLLKVNYKRLSTVEKRKYSIKLKQEIKIAKKEKALENKSVNTLKKLPNFIENEKPKQISREDRLKRFNDGIYQNKNEPNKENKNYETMNGQEKAKYSFVSREILKGAFQEITLNNEEFNKNLSPKKIYEIYERMINSAYSEFDINNLNAYYDEFGDHVDEDYIEEAIFKRSLKQKFLQFLQDYLFMTNMYNMIYKEIVKVFNKDNTKQTKTKLLGNFIISYSKLRRKAVPDSDKKEYI